MAKSDASEVTQAALQAAAKSAEAMPEPTIKPKLQALGRSDLRFFELMSTVWRCKAPRDASPEDLVDDPEVLVALSTDLKRRDLIWFDAPDERWTAEYLVLESAPIPRLKLLRAIGLPPRESGAEQRLPDGWRLVRSEVDQLEGWIAVRPDGRKIMSSGGVPFRRREDAIRHVLDSAVLRGSSGPQYSPGR